MFLSCWVYRQVLRKRLLFFFFLLSWTIYILFGILTQPQLFRFRKRLSPPTAMMGISQAQDSASNISISFEQFSFTRNRENSHSTTPTIIGFATNLVLIFKCSFNWNLWENGNFFNAATSPRDQSYKVDFMSTFWIELDWSIFFSSSFFSLFLFSHPGLQHLLRELCR